MRKQKQCLALKSRIFFSLALAAACAPGFSFAAAEKPVAPVVGADRDAHGCIGSAGYIYSQVQVKCVRLLEGAIRLDPVAKPHGAKLAAFLLFRSETGEGNAEIFLPRRNGSLVLKQAHGDNAGLWKAPGYKLSQWKGMYLLDSARGQSLYQGMASQ